MGRSSTVIRALIMIQRDTPFVRPRLPKNENGALLMYRYKGKVNNIRLLDKDDDGKIYELNWFLDFSPPTLVFHNRRPIYDRSLQHLVELHLKEGNWIRCTAEQALAYVAAWKMGVEP